MPYLQRDGYRMHATLSGGTGRPVLLLSHSLGAHLGMWKPQVKYLGKRFRLLRYDHPGHGRSEPRPSPATIADLGGDVLALLDELGFDSVSFCGLSLGGMVGLWLGAHAPRRVSRLVICSAPARIEDPTLLRRRVATIRGGGIEAIADSVMAGWFSPAFRERDPRTVAWARRMLLSTNAEAYAAMAETICGLDLRGDLARIPCPVLVLNGSEDTATPPAWIRAVQLSIPGSVGRSIPAGHLMNVEAADAFNEEVARFAGA